MASTYGAVFGAILLTFLPELLVVFEDYEMLVYGSILMLVMIFMPQGLFIGLGHQLTQLKKNYWPNKTPAGDQK
jgi:branched-chain amino acid transport system permease protein